MWLLCLIFMEEFVKELLLLCRNATVNDFGMWGCGFVVDMMHLPTKVNICIWKLTLKSLRGCYQSVLPHHCPSVFNELSVTLRPSNTLFILLHCLLLVMLITLIVMHVTDDIQNKWLITLVVIKDSCFMAAWLLERVWASHSVEGVMSSLKSARELEHIISDC